MNFLVYIFLLALLMVGSLTDAKNSNTNARNKNRNSGQSGSLRSSVQAMVPESMEESPGQQMQQQEEPMEGLPPGGVPILPEHLDFAAGLQAEDFVIDVVSRPPRQGEGGTVQARESPNTPALQGQGIALSLFTIDEGGQNLIHYHPRATELLYVIRGRIEVGFTATTGELFMNEVEAGQATVFPRALLHFQRNIGTGTAQYISILNSENPGVMSFPRVFATLPSDIIAQAFRTPENEIQDIQSRVVPPSLSEGGVNANYDGAAGETGNAPVPPFTEGTTGSNVQSSPGQPMSGSNDKEAEIKELYEKLKTYLNSKK